MKEMIMPQNYVELEQEEMMYLEGGGLDRNWYNSTGNIGKAIDSALFLAGLYVGGMSAVKAVAKYGTKITATLSMNSRLFLVCL